MKIVRILLVGDPQCGKTSIILALVGEEFPTVVPPRAEEITIPGDVTPEKVPTHILDFSSQEQDEGALQQEIQRADVVCVVYDLTNSNSLDRVTGYWLPFLRKCVGAAYRPVILAGNKADLPYDADLQSNKLHEILNTYLEVETGLECSAKDIQNISELFYFAQKAVLHPTAPLYSPNDKQLKPLCVVALTRVFKICDQDNDGFLNDQELNDFQILCFDAPLQPQALMDIKLIIQKNVENGVVAEGISLEGFLFLNKLFIQRGRHETAWKIVRKFGYSNDLEVMDSYLQPVFGPSPGSSVELTAAGYQYLEELFHKYDVDRDQALSDREIQEMFSLCPEEYDWEGERLVYEVETTPDNGWVTLAGFLAFWTMQTTLDYTFTASFLAYTGYPGLKGDLASSLKEVGMSQHKKTVYRCQVLGGKGCGKSSFVRGLVGKALEEVPEEVQVEESMSIRSLTLPSSAAPVYLLMQENMYAEDTDVSVTVGGALDQCDVACLLYDSSDPSSFEVATSMMNSLDNLMPNQLPYVFIATKTDLPRVRQECELQPDDFCKELGLPTPVPVSMESSSSFEHLLSLYHRLAAIARDPACNLPSSIRIHRWVKYTSLALLVGLGLGTLIYVLRRTGRLSIRT